MRIQLLAVSMLLSLICLSCSQNSPLIKNELIYLDKDTLRQGDNFTLYYNTNIAGAKFRDTAELYAGLGFMRDRKVKYYILKLEKGVPGIMSCKFTVPSSANVLFTLIGKRNSLNEMYRDNKNFPIYLKGSSALPKETINFFFIRTENADQFFSLLKQDTTYYSEYFERYYVMSQLSAEHGQDSIGIRMRIDELERIFYNDQINDYKIKANLCVNISNSKQLFGDWRGSMVFIDTLIDYYKTKKLLSDECISKIIIDAPIFSAPNPFMKKWTAAEFEALITKYLELAKVSNSYDLETRVIRKLFFTNYLSMPTPQKTLIVDHYFEGLKENFRKGYYDPYISMPDIFSFIYTYYDKAEDYQKFENVLDYAIKFDTLFSRFKISKDTNDVVSLDLGSSSLDYYESRLSDVYLKTGRLKEAKVLSLRGYDNNRFEKHYLFGTILSNLVRIYLKEDSLDAAESFLKKMYEINESRSGQYLTILNQYRKTKGLDSVSEKEFIASKGIDYHKMVNLYNLDLLIDGKRTNCSEFENRTLVLLNINDDCPVCNLNVKDILQTLRMYENKGNCKVILLSNAPRKALTQAFGDGICISKRTDEIVKRLNIDKENWIYTYIYQNNKYYAERDYITDPKWYESFWARN